MVSLLELCTCICTCNFGLWEIIWTTCQSWIFCLFMYICVCSTIYKHHCALIICKYKFMFRNICNLWSISCFSFAVVTAIHPPQLLRYCILLKNVITQTKRVLHTKNAHNHHVQLAMYLTCVAFMHGKHCGCSVSWLHFVL